MSTAFVNKPLESDNEVIQLTLVDGKLARKPKVRYNKDGSIDKRHTNTVSGVSNEVYPLVNEEEIKAMTNVFDKHIEEARHDNQRQIACRNKMIFLIGINLGLRASDLCDLKYSFFMNEDGTFKDSNKLKPKKTKKTGKFVPLHFNRTIKKAITDYIEKYPFKDMDEYLFKSRKGGAISEPTLWEIMNKTAIEAGIERNIGSHSLRKTFGYWIWHNAEDKNGALITLQSIFNHSSPAVTSKYIGLTNEEIGETFNNLNLGIDLF